MATIGHLKAIVSCNTTKFGAGMRQSNTLLGTFRQKVSMAGKALGIFGGLTTMVSAGGMALVIKRKMEWIDTTAKLSKSLGISSKALVGFQHAAGLTGTNTETLNRGLQKLVRTLGEVKGGRGEGLRGLEILQLDAKKLTALRPEQALYRIAGAMEGLEDPTLRSAAAVALFGRGGQDMMNFLTQGEAGLRNMVAEAERLGMTFSDKVAKDVQKANDAMQKFREAFGAFGTKAAGKAAPALETAADIGTWSLDRPLSYFNLGMAGITRTILQGGEMFGLKSDMMIHELNQQMARANRELGGLDKPKFRKLPPPGPRDPKHPFNIWLKGATGPFGKTLGEAFGGGLRSLENQLRSRTHGIAPELIGLAGGRLAGGIAAMVGAGAPGGAPSFQLPSAKLAGSREAYNAMAQHSVKLHDVQAKQLDVVRRIQGDVEEIARGKPEIAKIPPA